MKKYFTSFYPLCCTAKGRQASEKYQLPPYIDGSCRREPDFEHPMPCITGLCRPGFSKKLEVGEIIVYTTNRLGVGDKKIVAIFEVMEKKPTHEAAAQWYDDEKLPLPNNLMVSRTKPYPLNMTHELGDWIRWEKDSIVDWNNGYKVRSLEFPDVAICKIWKGFCKPDHPKAITNSEIKKIFGRIPGTRNPPAMQDQEWERFKNFIRRSTN